RRKEDADRGKDERRRKRKTRDIERERRGEHQEHGRRRNADGGTRAGVDRAQAELRRDERAAEADGAHAGEHERLVVAQRNWSSRAAFCLRMSGRTSGLIGSLANSSIQRSGVISG